MKMCAFLLYNTRFLYRVDTNRFDLFYLKSLAKRYYRIWQYIFYIKLGEFNSAFMGKVVKMGNVHVIQFYTRKIYTEIDAKIYRYRIKGIN